MVPPDLEDTRNNVRAGSTASVTSCTHPGTVESSTISSGYPGALPKLWRIISGPRLLPPMPSSTTWRVPDSRTSPAKASSAGTCSHIKSLTVSHPEAVGQLLRVRLPDRVVPAPDTTHHIPFVQFSDG